MVPKGYEEESWNADPNCEHKKTIYLTVWHRCKLISETKYSCIHDARQGRIKLREHILMDIVDIRTMTYSSLSLKKWKFG